MVTIGQPVSVPVITNAVQVGDGTPGVLAPAVEVSEREREAMVAALARFSFPRGLATELAASTEVFPVRFFVLDNSGSMSMGDGNRIVVDGAGKRRAVTATRWEELIDSASTIAELSETLGARTDFHLLNRSGRFSKFLTVGGDSSAASFVPCSGEKVSASMLRQRIQQVTPNGGTPLTESVMAIVSMLEPVAHQMRARGQQAVVTLMTDGKPNDPRSFAAALQALQALPVWLVVRLFTDDDAVVSYWDELDQSLETGLEVLDDDAGEAAEVTGKNRWLTYGAPLHAARTFGLSNKLFDLLDEATLLPSQAKLFVELLLGCELPEPEIEPQAFDDALRAALASASPVYDPLRKCERAWVDVKQLARSMRKTSSSGCSLM